MVKPRSFWLQGLWYCNCLGYRLVSNVTCRLFLHFAIQPMHDGNHLRLGKIINQLKAFMYEIPKSPQQEQRNVKTPLCKQKLGIGRTHLNVTVLTFRYRPEQIVLTALTYLKNYKCLQEMTAHYNSPADQRTVLQLELKNWQSSPQ